jgi:hypothetical protein
MTKKPIEMASAQHPSLRDTDRSEFCMILPFLPNGGELIAWLGGASRRCHAIAKRLLNNFIDIKYFHHIET